MTVPSRRPEPALLSSYVVIAVMTVLGLVVFLEPGQPLRWAGLGLLAAFDLLVLLPDRALGGFKQRVPHLYLGTATTLAGTLIALPPVNPWFAVLFFILSPEAMLRLPRQIGYAWVGTFAAVTVAVFWLVGRGEPGLFFTALIYIAGYFFFAAFATQTALAQAAQAESQQLLRELHEAHTRLQTYAAQVETLAVAEERNRLAREMHDTLGHRLTVVAVQLEAIIRLIVTDPERATAMARAAREEVRTALAELRQTVAALRTPLEADLPLEPALRRLAAEFEMATGLPVTLHLPAALPALPATHRLALYRAAQEGLTNVQKHAAATQAWLTLTVTDGQVSLSIADDGRGPATDAVGGFGLRGLRERADYLGGTVTLRPGPQGGTELVMTLPLEMNHG